MSDETGSRDETGSKSSAARLFDIRRIIGGLFVLYGVVLFVAGLVDGDAAKKQAADIDINVWTGLGMLATGVFFLVWMRLNPVEISPDDDEPAEPEGGSPAH